MNVKLNAVKKLTRGMLYSRGLKLGKLDGYERLIAAIYGTPDRVPVLAQPYVYAMWLHHLPARRFFSDPLTFVNASANMAKWLGIDFWSPVFDFYNIELEALGQPLIWREQSEPDVDTRNPLIKTEDDLRRLRPPVPGRDGRMPFVLDSYKRYMDIMQLPPMAYACSPFTMAVLVRGYVNFLRDMRRNPAFAHRLMNFLSMEVVVPWIDKMVEATGAAIIVMSDAWASQPNVTTQMVREFCLPYTEKVIRATNSPMRTVMNTGSWGERAVADPREVLDIKMEMMTRGNPFPALRPFYLLVWNEDYEEVGIAPIRAYAEEKKVCLLINVRPDLIETGPVERIVSTVKELIAQGAGKGRFTLLANMIPPGTPESHAQALVAAVKQFGRYPIAPDLEAEEFKPPAFPAFADWHEKEGLPV